MDVGDKVMDAEPRDYFAWWTSIETDVRKSMLVFAHREPERLHALVRQAYEAGQHSMGTARSSASLGEDGLPISDEEIAGIMGWRGPGAYTEGTLRKIRRIVERAVVADRRARQPVLEEQASVALIQRKKIQERDRTIADLRAQLASEQHAKQYEQGHAAESEKALAQAQAQLTPQSQGGPVAELMDAADALVERWHSRDWKQPHTADFILRLAAAVGAIKFGAPTTGVEKA